MVKKTEIKLLYDLLGVTAQEFYYLTKNSDNFYHTFKIPKRRGGYRIISSPMDKLLEVQRIIYKKILKPNFHPSDHCVGFVHKKNIIDNVMPHLGNDYVLKIDLKDFFPSIRFQNIIRIFKRLGYSHRVSYLLTRLCCRNNVLPQGAPTSPTLSNMVMKTCDYRLKIISQIYNLTYTRYADDLTFSSKECFTTEIVAQIYKVLEDSDLQINQNKTQILGPKDKKIITGISISSGCAKLPRITKRRWKQEFYLIKKYGLFQHMRNIKQILPTNVSCLQGQLSFWKMVEPDNKFIADAYKTLNEVISNLSK